MRLVLLIAVLARTASADPALSEWNENTRLRPADQLALGPCSIAVTFRGAIADFELHQTIRNPGPGELAGSFELELPVAATMIGLAVDGTAGIGVRVNPNLEQIESTDVLGADPALVSRVSTDRGRARYRAIVQPLRPERELVLGLRWTQVADIHDSALHAKLFGRLDGSTCNVAVKALPGPGATAKPAAGFVLAGEDVTIDVELAIKGNAPIAWLQTADLGEGETARALTVIAPAVRTEGGGHRVVFVVDTSRSMELVGRNNVRRLVAAITAALPQGSVLEAVLFDRNAERVLKSWQPASAAAGAIDAALAKHGAENGSDPLAALALAQTALAEPGGPQGQAMVIAITDGVFDASPQALAKALGGRADTLDVHSLVLDPHGMAAPAGDAMHLLVTTYGGSAVEVSIDSAPPFGGAASPGNAGLAIDNLDRAIGDVATWLRPAWQELAITGAEIHLPSEIRAGGGFVDLSLGARPDVVKLASRGDVRTSTIASKLPAAPIAQLALAPTDDDNFGDGDHGELRRAKLTQRNPAVDDEHDLAVLSTLGRVAAQRRQMIAGGGPYTRMVALADPAFVPTVTIGTASTTGGSALDRTIIKRLLDDQLQPHAYSCYARSLGRMIALAGTATFQIELGRGEVTNVTVTGFEDNPEFHACLVDAAYGLAPPMPTPGYNLDDRSSVSYPLTFRVRDKQPDVSATDAAVTPAAAIPVDGQRPKLDVGDTSTPLGNVKPRK